MLSIAFRFPAGRYHATAWDHHVNEGLVEWPPSPWRILRALLASSYKCREPLDAGIVRSTLEQLTGLPSYSVPPVGDGHLRHFMPLGALKDGRVATAKIFDAFVAPGDGELSVSWPDAQLDSAHARVLDQLLDQLTYLGRAESWVDARRVDAVSQPLNCVPADNGTHALHALLPPPEYASWRQGFVEGQKHLPTKQRREPPSDWWQVLHHDTNKLFAEAWSRPPGLRTVRYRMEPLKRSLRRSLPSARAAAPTVAWYELTSSVRPRLTEAVALGDRMRKAAMSQSGAHPVFVGRRDGSISAGHGHAFFLPSDDDADGFIDHLAVCATDGFDATALAALRRTTRLWGRGSHDLHLTLLDVGTSSLFGGRRGQLGTSPLLARARIWESHTPFVPPRHAKRRRGRWLDTASDQIATLMEARGLPRPDVRLLSADDLHMPQPAQRLPWYRFRRRRLEGGGAHGDDRGFGFRLTFPVAVEGPLAVGYGAHQGLGLFVAVEE